MPDRFKYLDTETLLERVKALDDLLSSDEASTNALRNSATGFLKQTANLTEAQIRRRWRALRYEVYLRGQGVDGNPPNALCAQMEPTDPLREQVMHVHSNFQKWPTVGTWPAF